MSNNTSGFDQGVGMAYGCCSAPFMGCGGIVVLSLILGAFGVGRIAQKTETKTVNGTTVTVAKASPSVDELNSVLSNSGATQAQKDEYWNSVVGTIATWTGEVREVRADGDARLGPRLPHR